ncbi:MAG: DNA polymerase III subunit gamma/tau [Verrucomicrobia bacterium]|nr:DNA polymerase III subunit gamma/tau [Verrucomicrobiota bacterium]
MDSKPSQYQVIARKYRPQTFASVVGQEAIVTTLKNALRLGRLAHAYLFCGCRGTGKTTLARVFAKALNCSHPTDDFEPCNACSSCLDIIAGRSLDVLEIDGASNRGIDDIRQINETIGYAPASGKYKIYIIDEVHMLTKEAFNALLKTLEEPPANVKFFFATTEPHKVLPTIISRCQRFDLNRIPFEALKKKLAWIAQDMNVPCDEDVISLVANLSEGSLRDAESLFDQIICYAEHPITAAKVAATLGIMPRSAFFSLDSAFEEQNLSFAFELAGDIFSSGKDLSYFIDNLIEHYRSLLKLKLGAVVAFPTARLKEQYVTSSTHYTEEQCLYILDFLIQWQQQIGKTPFKRVSLEMILLHIIRSKHRLTLPALVRRLQELEQKLPAASESPKIPAPVPSSKYSAEKTAEPPQMIAPAPSQAPRTIENKAAEKIVEITQMIAPAPAEALPAIEANAAEKTIEPPQAAAAPLESSPAINPAPVQQKPQDAPSLEETLMKKIREKIESSPAPIEELEESESPIQESLQEPSSEAAPKQPPLLFSKAKWEAIASEKESQTTIPPSLPDKGISQSALASETIAATLAPEKRGQTPAPAIGKASEASSMPQASPAALPQAPSSRYDTLMRFAAVELEGTLKKEQPNG